MKHPDSLPGGRNAKLATNNNSTNNNISKRSNVMNATTVISRALIAFVSIFLMITVAIGGDLNLNGNGGTLSGTYNIKSNINTGSASGVYTFSGTVNLNGTGGVTTQTIAMGGGSTATKALVFTTLNAGAGAGARAIIQGGIVTVDGAYTLNVPTQSYTVGAHTLNFASTVTSTAGTFDASDGGSIVNYTTGPQLVLASTYGGTLGLQGGSGATKTFSNATSAAIVTTAALTPVSVNNNLTITGTSLSTIADLSVSATKVLDVQGTGGLTVTALTANAGTIQKTTAGGTITFSNDISTAGLITSNIAGGILTFSGIANAATGGTISLTSSATANFAKDLTTSGTGSLSFGGTSTANFTGTAAQNIAAPISFYNANMSGGGAKTFTGSAQTITFASGGTFANADQTTDFGTNVLSYTGATLSQTTGTVKFGGASNGVIFAQGTVDYNAAGPQTITGSATLTYANLLLSGSGAKQVATAAAGTVHTTTNLNISTGVSLDVVAGGIVQVDGDLNVNGTGTITNAGTITVGS